MRAGAWWVGAWLVFVCLASRPALADDASERRAHQLFDEGRASYQRGKYQRAYDRFKEAYLLSPRGELLYNMARALEELHRPGEAAEAYRAYLRVLPDDPDRGRIEEQVRALEESQRLVSQGAPPAATVTLPAARPLSLTWLTPPEPGRRRIALIAGVVSAVVVTVLAVALGVGLGVSASPNYLPADLGPLKSTR